MQVSIIGAGHVGLTTAACFAHCGHQVTVVDIDRARVRDLKAGRLPFFEPHLGDLLNRNRERVQFTTDYQRAAHAEVALLAVPSPTGSGGAVDLTYVRTAAESLGQALRERRAPEPMLIVNKCTVPVGTAQMVAGIVRSQLSPSGPPLPFSVASCPEFLREGRAVQDTLYPDRIVIGVSSGEAEQELRHLYAGIRDQRFPPVAPGLGEGSTPPRVVVTSTTTAELVKYAANTFLAVKLSFINEIASLSSAVGADIQDVADGIGLDRRIGRSFLDAGIGWGGSCLGKDLRGLISTAAEYELPTALLSASLAVNERQRGVVTRLLQEELRVLKGARIALFGLAFKPDTDDLRDAPSLEIAGRLLAWGADVVGYDPVVRQVPVPGLEIAGSARDAAARADAVVLVTEWAEFQQLDWQGLAAGMRNPLLVDGRNALRADQMEAVGFRYRSIGR